MNLQVCAGDKSKKTNFAGGWVEDFCTHVDLEDSRARLSWSTYRSWRQIFPSGVGRERKKGRIHQLDFR